MGLETLTMPSKGFTKAERAWLAKLIEAIKTVQGIEGSNISISNGPAGQTINASDCPPCP